MLDCSIFYFTENVIILTLLFWILSFFGDKFFKEKNSKYSQEVFECGFLSTSSLNLNFNFNFFIACSLLILYDIEVLLLAPYIFNFTYSSPMSIFIFISFYTLVLSSLVIDWEFVSINWSI